jgi:hypothetical protein
VTYPGGAWRVSLSRRGALLLPVILGAAGCTRSADSDPYIAAMMKDPMYAWNPPMSVKRHVSSLPRNGSLERVSHSVIDIWLTPEDPGSVPSMTAAAIHARSDAGYSEQGRRYAGVIDERGCWIECTISESIYSPGSSQPPGASQATALFLKLAAPYLEP